MRIFLQYFLRGVLVTVPVFITIYVIYSIVVFVGSLFNAFGLIIHPAIDPFIVLLSVGSIIFFVGFFSNSILLPFITAMDQAMEKAPFIKVLYTSIKDLVSAFVDKKKRFNQPVLVKYASNPEVMRLGFITKENLSELGLDANMIAVYLPYSFGFSGEVVVVSKEHVTPIKASSADVMKMIVSGGVTEVD